MTMYANDTTTTITAAALHRLTDAGVQFTLVFGRGRTLDEAQAYAYGSTLVFDLGVDGIYLIATGRDDYTVNYQHGRYQSGLWGVRAIELENLTDEVVDTYNVIGE